MVLITRATRNRVRTSRVRTLRVRVNGDDGGIPPEIATGLVAWLSFHDPAYYTLSGSTITSVTNRVTGVKWPSVGSPAYSATGFNGGPGCVFDGTDKYFYATEASVIACFQDANAHTVCCDVDLGNDDASQFIVSGGKLSVSNDSRRGFGTSPTLAGAWRDYADNDAGTVNEVLGANGAPTTDPTILQWYGSTTTSLLINGVADGGAYPGAQNPGTLTPTHVLWGALPASTGVTSPCTGPVSQLLIYSETVPASGADTTLDTIAQFMADLNGVSL